MNDDKPFYATAAVVDYYFFLFNIMVNIMRTKMTVSFAIKVEDHNVKRSNYRPSEKRFKSRNNTNNQSSWLSTNYDTLKRQMEVLVDLTNIINIQQQSINNSNYK